MDCECEGHPTAIICNPLQRLGLMPKSPSLEASRLKTNEKHKKRSGTIVEKGQKETTKLEYEDDEDSVGSDGSRHASSGEDVNDLQESDHINEEEEENEEKPQVSSEVSDDAPTEDAAEPKGEHYTTPIKKSASGRCDRSHSKRVLTKNDPSVEDEPEIATDSKQSVDEEPARKTSMAIIKNGTPVKSNDKKKSSRKSASSDASESGPSKCSNPKGEDRMKDHIKEKDAAEEKSAKKKEDKPEKMTNKKEDKSEKKVKKKKYKSEKKGKKKEDKPEKMTNKKEYKSEKKGKKKGDKFEKKTKKKDDEPAPTVSTKKQVRGKTSAGPSREELHSVISIILEEVDFLTTTLGDILNELGTYFNMDMMDRKAEVKNIIVEIIDGMMEDEDAGEDEDSEGEDKREESDEGGE